MSQIDEIIKADEDGAEVLVTVKVNKHMVEVLEFVMERTDPGEVRTIMVVDDEDKITYATEEMIESWEVA